MKIVIATGGSGGHIFPALHVAEELRRLGHEVIFVGTFGARQQKVSSQGFVVHEVEAQGLTGRSIKKNILTSLRMAGAVVKSLRLLSQIRPNVVAGFGGYGAFPVVVASFLKRIPVLIHEQNVCPGRANALVAKLADKFAVSFEQSRKHLDGARLVVTGCPAKKPPVVMSKEEVYRRVGFRPELPTILILGGSQGSRRINAIFVDTAPLVRKEMDFQIIHIAGKDDVAGMRSFYERFHIPHYVCEFMDDIENAYLIGDLAISRAGAVSITELMNFNIPSILIPYPFAGRHQRENALAMVCSGRAQMIEEENLSARGLAETVLTVLRQKPLAPISATPAESAAARIAQEIVSLG